MSEDVQVANDSVFPILQIGQKVQTPEGPGTIVDISIQAGQYGDSIELEPPAVTVELASPGKNPPRIQVCICRLGLEDPEHEVILSKEFQRLWPPIEEDIPEYAHQLVDVTKVEGEDIMANVRTAALRPIDKRVLKAFSDKKPMEGRLLMSDGEVLHKLGMGGGEFARWEDDRVVITRETAVRSDDVIVRALKKVIPKNWLVLPWERGASSDTPLLDKINKRYPANKITSGYREDPTEPKEIRWLWKQAAEDRDAQNQHTADEYLKDKVKQWMESHHQDYGDNLTKLAENAAWEFDHDEWLDDQDHWVWELSVDVMDAAGKLASVQENVMRNERTESNRTAVRWLGPPTKRSKEADRGARWFSSLPNDAKWDLGDALVHGHFEWEDWMDDEPSADFLRGVDKERWRWEDLRDASTRTAATDRREAYRLDCFGEEGEFYADEEEGMHYVFGSESGFAYSSHFSLEEAEEAAKEENETCARNRSSRTSSVRAAEENEMRIKYQGQVYEKVEAVKVLWPGDDYNPEARELSLYIGNDEPLYRRLMDSFYPNLIKKLAQGRYNRDLAPKLFMYLVEEGAKKYTKEFSSPGDKWHQIFNKEVRMMVAVSLRDEFEQLIKGKELDEEYLSKHTPKKYKGVDLAKQL